MPREDFTKVAGRALEDYFKRSLGLTDARAEDNTVEYMVNKGIVVGTIPPDATANATGVIVNGSIGDLSPADGRSVRVQSANTSSGTGILVGLNSTVPWRDPWILDKLESITVIAAGNLSKTAPAGNSRPSILLYLIEAFSQPPRQLH